MLAFRTHTAWCSPSRRSFHGIGNVDISYLFYEIRKSLLTGIADLSTVIPESRPARVVIHAIGDSSCAIASQTRFLQLGGFIVSVKRWHTVRSRPGHGSLDQVNPPKTDPTEGP